MGALLLKADNESKRILLQLAKKLGAVTLNINNEHYEDLALGYLIDVVKTRETIDRVSVMKKLRRK